MSEYPVGVDILSGDADKVQNTCDNKFEICEPTF